ncbi:hypothetical protein JCM16418A_30590 [Paenibacillus pini]
MESSYAIAYGKRFAPTRNEIRLGREMTFMQMSCYDEKDNEYMFGNEVRKCFAYL